MKIIEAIMSNPKGKLMAAEARKKAAKEAKRYKKIAAYYQTAQACNESGISEKERESALSDLSKRTIKPRKKKNKQKDGAKKGKKGKPYLVHTAFESDRRKF